MPREPVSDREAKREKVWRDDITPLREREMAEAKEKTKLKPEKTCARCGREGHARMDCSEKTRADGTPIKFADNFYGPFG